MRLAAGVALVALAALALPGRATAAGADDPLARADTLFARQDWAGAAAAYEEAARRSPDSFRIWLRLGAAESARSRWDRAVAALRRADALPGVPFLARYNLACVFARSGERDSALASLRLLMDRGYRSAAQIEGDADFESLRGSPAFAALVQRAHRNANPCADRAESRQFDFWIGEWDVLDRQRGLGRAGTSRIELILGQCVLLENWTGGLGGHGKSFNLWNPDTRCWQQTWVDDNGQVTYFDRSRVENGAIVFITAGKGPDGRPTSRRLSFIPLGPDEVRQWSEVSTDGGATWVTGYDFLYRRRK